METLAYTYLSLAYEGQGHPLTHIQPKQKLSHACFRALGGILLLSYLASPAQAVLQPGDQGEGVVALQTFLGRQGYFQGKATGYYGEGTTTAVIRYQQVQGLTPDGIVGVATQRTFCDFTQITQTMPAPQLQPRQVKLVAQAQVTPNENVVLGVGSAGEQVELVQRRLRELGYFSEEVTGYFGELTREAVLEFQRDRGLTPDGLVGENTLTILQATTPAPSVVVSPEVRALQQRLKDAGFYQGAVDGIWGPQTQAAVDAAQRAFSIQLGDLQ